MRQRETAHPGLARRSLLRFFARDSKSRAVYRAYFTRVLPLVGRLVSNDREAYEYLPRTVLAWPSPDEFEREMAAEGLVGCGHRLLTRGIACIHWGMRAAEVER